MKTADVRKLIGRPVTWLDTWCPRRQAHLERHGVILEVKGKNVLVDQNGSNDWRWLPDMIHLKAADPSPSPHPGDGT